MVELSTAAHGRSHAPDVRVAPGDQAGHPPDMAVSLRRVPAGLDRGSGWMVVGRDAWLAIIFVALFLICQP